jgi:hypothetical protein
MDNSSNWTALAADGTTPSTALTLANETVQVRFGTDKTSGRLKATTDALNHTLQRSLLNLDLMQFDDIRLSLKSNRLADNSPMRPFYLEVRLASAAMGLNNPANTWRRFLPVTQRDSWDLVRLDLNNLPPLVRGAVNLIQFRCTDASTPFVCFLDDLLAVHEEMIVDVDAALVARLNDILTIGGNPVPAVMHPANGALNQNPPYFEITHYDIVHSRERTRATRARVDFTDDRYSLRPPSNAYELYYQITAEADDRPAQSQMLEFLLRSLPPSGDLPVNGLPLPIESIAVPPFDQVGKLQTNNIPLFYKISTRQEVGTADLVTAAKIVIIAGDLRA